MCKLNNTTTKPYWQVVVCLCGTIVTIFWGLFAALLLENSVLGVSVVCLFSLGLMYAIGRSVNQMGARLAAVTEYVDLSLLQSMKGHLLARCPSAKHEKFFDKVDTHSMHRAHTVVLQVSTKVHSQQLRRDTQADESWEETYSAPDAGRLQTRCVVELLTMVQCGR